MPHVHCRLREYRQAKRMSLDTMAAESGVAKGVLSLIENGRLFPTSKHVAGLERAYGHPITDWYDQHVLLALQRDEAEAA